MCTKHASCRASKKASTVKVGSASQASLDSVSSCHSLKMSTIRPAGESVQSEDSDSSTCCDSSPLEEDPISSCCSSSSCSSLDSGSTEHDQAQTSSCTSENIVHTFSWKVEGMDCPSCARKVETAVLKIQDVLEAKVLFATEKLIVKSKTLMSKGLVEQAVTKAGFSHSDSSKPKQPVQALTTKQTTTVFIKQNFNLIVLSTLMLLGVITEQFSSEVGQLVFTIACITGIFPIGKKALKLAASGTPFAIETLMTVAALGALYLGETVEAAMVLVLFMLGERLEAYAASRARSGVQALMALVPEVAVKIVNGERVEIAADSLAPGDVIEVTAGDRLPADGRLRSPRANFDESALTGESVPVDRQSGDAVVAGSVVTDQTVEIEITSKQGENSIDRILHLIEEAESRKAPLERFLDSFSRWYTPAMMLLSLLVIITPPLLFDQPWETWTYRGLALLLIACPCALVISTPAAITSGLAAAAKRGALIKGGAALEQLGRIEYIAFDKTGTLTKGKPEVTDVFAFNGLNERQLLSVVSAIETGSKHPLAKSLVQHSHALGVDIEVAVDRKALPGAGMEGVVNDHFYQILAPRHQPFPLEVEINERLLSLESQGKTVVVVIKTTEPTSDRIESRLKERGELVGVIAWQDTLRDDAKLAMANLKALNIGSVMLTGDNPRSAQAIATHIDIDFEADLLPQDKVAFVENVAKDNIVAMVGDGINDAPAMKASSIGIAMGGGTDVALEVADSALTHNRLNELPAMIELSRATLTNIRQNVILALGLKGVFLVTSLLGVTGLWVAVLADSGATALVTLNALRLLRFTPSTPQSNAQ